MFFAVAVSSYGFLTMVGKPHETKEAVLENFADAWAAFNSSNYHVSKDVKQYGIAQVVEGVEMTQPPKFALVPMLPALPKSATHPE